MIRYKQFTLGNGLRVYVHEDFSTPMAAVNILYNVGSRDEDEDRTGFAHLFEHLMFGGSKHIPSYDIPVQNVGGENNAFTSPDITNYYITLPADNVETAFWLESDRMLSLSFDPNVLEVQRKVVIEEFKQRYLNQPYGDMWLKLRPLAYKKHPYRWATIGKDIGHIERATMDDVQDFFFRFYRPNNAVMVVAGAVTFEKVQELAEKWFGNIPAGPAYVRNLPQEPVQTEARHLETSASVPLNSLVKVFHMPGRYDEGFYAGDLLSDVLGRGKSSRLYQKLLKERAMFNSISASIISSLDPGLLMIKGNLNPGVSLEDADEAVTEILQEVIENGALEEEVTKVKNQSEASLAFSEVELLNRAMNLAFAANAGNVEWANADAEIIRALTPTDIHNAAKTILRPENTSTLYYRTEGK
ncbi:M16 family metallopeptidase [Dyadobacter fermentans]|uniref:Peptidase M16 domain protein n=1 Tax=Dyadobacter fermentans (strain ATCC 700827 / DSM 18053 / CIP 107007 / KCTC 52180 / NS114) TaxID=471854 RepID=C6W5E8_DYAFD|nr:pitrilysin family protein [Dyadobacter fermentans]ACT94166.1 peptidase M16 domain protein [Dyadobacter fermentans DSM 18053]